jgi:hypothetical protein
MGDSRLSIKRSSTAAPLPRQEPSTSSRSVPGSSGSETVPQELERLGRPQNSAIETN